MQVYTGKELSPAAIQNLVGHCRAVDRDSYSTDGVEEFLPAGIYPPPDELLEGLLSIGYAVASSPGSD